MLQLDVGIDENDYLVEFESETFSVVLHFRWNSEWQVWVLGLQTLEGDPIIYGIPLFNRRFLLEPYAGLTGIPEGELLVSCDTEDNPGRDSFVDGSARLYYLNAEENNALL